MSELLRPIRRLGRRGGAVVALAGMASFFVSLDSSALVLALPAIGRDFHASVPALTDMGAVLQAGVLAGFPLGMLADRTGRRRLLIGAVIGFSIVNVGSALAPNLLALTLLRMVAVCLETAAAATAVALVVEEVPADVRAVAISALTIAAGAGTGLTTVLWPLLTPNWRVLYLIGGFGLVGAAVLAWRLRESRAWQAARTDQLALRVLLAAPWRKRLLIALAVSGLAAVFYQPAGLLVVLYGSRVGLSPALLSAVIVVSGALSLPAFPIGARLSDRFGRRLLAPGLLLATAVFGAVTFGGTTSAYWVGNVVWSVLASASAPVVAAWYGELFPTRARATSETAAAVAGAIGGVAGLQLVGHLTGRAGLGPSLMLGAVLAGGGALLLLLLPETRNEPLPQ
jgi:MFS transporter, DHA1 family, inner membrane transport protein